MSTLNNLEGNLDMKLVRIFQYCELHDKGKEWGLVKRNRKPPNYSYTLQEIELKLSDLMRSYLESWFLTSTVSYVKISKSRHYLAYQITPAFSTLQEGYSLQEFPHFLFHFIKNNGFNPLSGRFYPQYAQKIISLEKETPNKKITENTKFIFSDNTYYRYDNFKPYPYVVNTQTIWTDWPAYKIYKQNNAIASDDVVTKTRADFSTFVANHPLINATQGVSPITFRYAGNSQSIRGQILDPHTISLDLRKNFNISEVFSTLRDYVLFATEYGGI